MSDAIRNLLFGPPGAVYRCVNVVAGKPCGWTGTYGEMAGDHYCSDGDGEEVWSSAICPKCGCWQELEDYERVGGDG